MSMFSSTGWLKNLRLAGSFDILYCSRSTIDAISNLVKVCRPGIDKRSLCSCAKHRLARDCRNSALPAHTRSQ